MVNGWLSIMAGANEALHPICGAFYCCGAGVLFTSFLGAQLVAQTHQINTETSRHARHPLRTLKEDRETQGETTTEAKTRCGPCKCEGQNARTSL